MWTVEVSGQFVSEQTSSWPSTHSVCSIFRKPPPLCLSCIALVRNTCCFLPCAVLAVLAKSLTSMTRRAHAHGARRPSLNLYVYHAAHSLHLLLHLCLDMDPTCSPLLLPRRINSVAGGVPCSSTFLSLICPSLLLPLCQQDQSSTHIACPCSNPALRPPSVVSRRMPEYRLLDPPQ